MKQYLGLITNIKRADKGALAVYTVIHGREMIHFYHLHIYMYIVFISECNTAG